MSGLLRSTISMLCAILTFPGTGYCQTFSPQAWLEDFAQLKREMSSHYANLQWAVETRHLDLRVLSRQAEAQLRSAASVLEARRAIESFIDEFGDGHFWVEWPPDSPTMSATKTTAFDSSRLSLVERLGYHRQNLKRGIAFSMLPAFEEIKTSDSVYFPIGILQLGKKGKVGVIRIAMFSEHVFPDLCDSAVADLGLTADSPCTDDCEDLVDRRTSNRLTAALERQVSALKRRKIDLLIVDITGNGGGSNWVEPAARVLTAVPLRSPRTAFIRHEHWVRLLRERLGTITADSTNERPSQHKLRMQAVELLRKALAEAEQPCDLTPMWDDLKPSCSLVVADPVLHPDCILAYSRPGLLPDRPSSFILFYPSRYVYHEGAYSGPLLVLVDHGTASSAEYFAAMLRDNGAATILGEPTFGAGAGFTDGGIPTRLHNSGGDVKMPDCVRFRADGSNEMAGVTPDVLVPWRRNDNPFQRAERVIELLSQPGRLPRVHD